MLGRYWSDLYYFGVCITIVLLMLGRFVLLVYLCSTMLDLCAQPPPKRLHTLMCYNVENLFDTVDDPSVRDEEFLPESHKHWDSHRYRRKLDRIAQVIGRAGGDYWPTLVGLVEVENEQTLDDLLRLTSLRRADYGYVIAHGADPRGIDVAILYRRGLFALEASQEVEILFDHEPDKATRHLLHLSGRLEGKHWLDIWVCHFPSRREGVRRSEGYRRLVAQSLRARCDSLWGLAGEPRHQIIMGDFNGEPHELATARDLEAETTWDETYLADGSDHRLRLYNLFARPQPQGTSPGSYCYRGVWQQIDQMLISSSLLVASSPIRYRLGSARNYCPSYLGREPRQAGYLVPWRTYAGSRYLGGYSDHYPIVAQLEIDD